jgi:SAM-dependent methyltransferase
MRYMSINLSCRGLSYSLRRYFVDQFYDREVEKLPKGSFVLDVGGTKVNKRGFFNIDNLGHQVVYLNLSPQKLPDILGDVTSLPFGDNFFDVVICSELFEHLYNPREALAESLRVLKPNGVLLATIPFMYPQHPDPNDYVRYTEQFLFDELNALGYASIEVERQGGFWSVFADMFRAIVYEWHAQSRMKRLMSRIFLCGLLVDLLKSKALQWDLHNQPYRTAYCKGVTTGFGIKATKPA